MVFLLSMMIAGGVATFAYSKMGQRLGYTNTQDVVIVVGVVFVLSTIMAFTLLSAIGL